MAPIRGYVVIDSTPRLMKADWYFVPDVRVRSDRRCQGGKPWSLSAAQRHLQATFELAPSPESDRAALVTRV